MSMDTISTDELREALSVIKARLREIERTSYIGYDPPRDGDWLCFPSIEALEDYRAKLWTRYMNAYRAVHGAEPVT